MKAKYLSQPCRNYCILANLLLAADPKDGREKYVISTFASGETGRIILIDAETLEGETLELPADEGAWALYYLEETGELLIGTCTRYGYIHRLKLETRTWEKSVRIRGEEKIPEDYIWNFARGKDGCVYASNYPDCFLLKYDPKTQTISNAGRVGDDENNRYTRKVLTHPDGNILVGIGCQTYEIHYYDVEQKTFTKIGISGDELSEVTQDYIMTTNHDGTYRFYDSITFDLIDEPVNQKTLDCSKIKNAAVLAKMEVLKNPPYLALIPGNDGSHFQTMKNGRVLGVQGQELIVIDGNQVQMKQIPAEAPPTAILNMEMAENGILWGTCGFGQTIFSYNPETGEYVNTIQITKAGGEAFGICAKDGKIFLTCYAGGDHVVYDPKQPWNHHDNLNPKTLEAVAPQMIRPLAGSVIGPDGNLFTGWVAAYGTYGGGMSRVNTKTYEMISWYQLIPEQSFRSVASSKKFVYAVTSGEANGLAFRKDRFHILKMDCDCNIIWDKQCELGITFSKVIAIGDYILVSYHDENQKRTGIYIFREDTMEELPSLKLAYVSEMVAYDENTVVAFGDGHAYLVRIPDGTVLNECPIEKTVRSATKGKNNEIYFSNYGDSKLYLLEL